MIVFGDGNDDKGTQLEELTIAILNHLGVSNITKSKIRSGGGEIDVYGELKHPGISNSLILRVLCECKAHKQPNNMTDWYKFLGKVYSEEVSQCLQLQAYFVSLGGVNGNVSGHYQDFHVHRPNVILIGGDDLRRHIDPLFSVCPQDEVSRSIQRFTNRQPRSYDLAYYDKKVYWILLFDNDLFTILYANGELLDRSDVERLKALALDAVSASKYYDLKEESEAVNRSKRVRNYILSRLMIVNGRVQRQEIPLGDDLRQSEIDEAITSLAAENYIELEEDVLFLPEHDDPIYPASMSKILSSILGGEISLTTLDNLRSQYYRDVINDQFLDHILRVQGGFSLSSEDRAKSISVLRMSPSALLWAIHPNEMMVNHRTEGVFDAEKIETISDPFCRNYFLWNIYQRFQFDFRIPSLADIFHDSHKICELETAFEITAKSFDGVEFQAKTVQRDRIGQAGGGFVGPDGSKWLHMLVLDSTEQPWDGPKPPAKE